MRRAWNQLLLPDWRARDGGGPSAAAVGVDEVGIEGKGVWQGVRMDGLEASVCRGLLGARSRKSERKREFGKVHAILLGDGTAEGTLVLARPLPPSGRDGV